MTRAGKIEAERITAAHEAHYREHGFAVVENFLTPAELADAHADIETFLPGWLDYARNPEGEPPRDIPPPARETFFRLPALRATPRWT